MRNGGSLSDDRQKLIIVRLETCLSRKNCLGDIDYIFVQAVTDRVKLGNI